MISGNRDDQRQEEGRSKWPITAVCCAERQAIIGALMRLQSIEERGPERIQGKRWD